MPYHSSVISWDPAGSVHGARGKFINFYPIMNQQIFAANQNLMICRN